MKESANEKLFEILTNWKENLNEKCDKVELNVCYTDFLSDWLASTRIGNATLNTRKAIQLYKNINFKFDNLTLYIYLYTFTICRPNWY